MSPKWVTTAVDTAYNLNGFNGDLGHIQAHNKDRSQAIIL